MSKRASLEDRDDSVPVEKKTKLADNAQDIDQEAEWAAFQALIGESNVNTAEEENDKVDIELADDDESPIDEDEEEQFTSAWDEDDMNVEKRLENQEARKKYLEQLRAQRSTKQDRNEIANSNNKSLEVADDPDFVDEESLDEGADDDDDDDDKGWIK